MKKAKNNDSVIQFVGKRERFNPKTGKSEMVLRLAPARIVNGNKTIDLPPDQQQKKGFTHADAAFLTTHYPRLYKNKVKKGK